MRRALLPRLHGAWPQPLVGILTVLVGLLSLVAAWTRALHGGTPPTVGALALALGGVAAIVVAYRYPIHVRHQTKVLLVTLVYYLLAVLVPPPLATLAAGLGALAGEVARIPLSGSYPSDIASEVGRRRPPGPPGRPRRPRGRGRPRPPPPSWARPSSWPSSMSSPCRS